MAIPLTTDDFKWPIHIVTDGTAPPLELEEFQTEAVNKLKAHFAVEDTPKDLGYRPGLVVMPTGSGKTRTSVSWIMSDMIGQGYKILWLVHRTNLLEQTARTMVAARGAAGAVPKKKLVLRCVSSQHNPSSTASFKNDDILVFSILSLARRRDLIPYLLKGVRGDRLLVVVDEAHHIPMNSYRQVLKNIAQHRPGFKLLGLTATPTRTSESERKLLHEMFGNLNAVYWVTMGKLISTGFLATPIFERPKTEIDITTGVGEDLLALMAKYRDIPEKLLTTIAENGLRNKIIVDRYMQDIDRYGQTLVFAVNKLHCHMLKKAFDEAFKKYNKQNGTNYECDYIESGRPDNDDVLDRFKRGEIRVLINIEILTEGTDVPGIQTVFLTRPTASDTLLMQMVGRGMRGTAVEGGTAEVFIVDFQDNWDRFNYWLDPKIVLEGEIKEPEKPKESEDEEVAAPGDGEILYAPIPPEIIADIVQTFKDPAAVTFSAIIPVGWYMVSFSSAPDNTDEQAFGPSGSDAWAEERRILVYANQVEAFEEIRDNLDWFRDPKSPGYEEVIEKFFADTTDPLPRKKDLEAIVDFIRHEREMPMYFTFAERDQIDPRKMAQTIWDGQYSVPAKYKYLEDVFEENLLMQQMYGDLSELVRIVDREMQIIAGVVKIDHGPVVANPEWKVLSPGPHHDLEILYEEVITAQFGGNAHRAATIKWTSRPVKSYWGQFRYGDRKMLINSLLDSPEVPAEVIKFLIYHEQLHAQGYKMHDLEFRRIERRYPDYQEWNNFLDTLTERYKTPWSVLRDQVLARDSHRCVCCGQELDGGVSLLLVSITDRGSIPRRGADKYQSMCRICRDINSSREINFRDSRTSMGTPLDELELIRPAAGETPQHSLQRIINFYYGGSAFAKLIKGETLLDNNYDNWKIVLHKGSDPAALLNHKNALLQYIRDELQAPQVTDLTVVEG